MTRLPFLLLGLLAAGLAVLTAWQLEARPPDAPASPGASRGASAAAPRAVAPAADRGEWVATSLARPLFSPDRRPPPADAAAGLASGPAEPPRLTGILITPAGRRAIFAGAREPSILYEGGRIGGYLVQSISAAQVTLVGSAGLRTLQPSYDPRPAGGAPGGGTVSAVAGAPAAELPFEAKPAPSGLDILRNSARQASRATILQPSGEAAPAGPPDPLGAPANR